MEQYIYLVTLGIFLLTSIYWLVRIFPHLFYRKERSHWKRQQLRLHAGILVWIILALFSYLAFYLFFRERGPGHVFTFVGLFSAMVIVQTGLAVDSLSDRRHITWPEIFGHYAIPVLLTTGYGLILYLPSWRDDFTELIEFIAWGYYACYVVIMLYFSMKQARSFHQRLEDSYVEIDQRQVMYRTRSIIYCVSMFFLFIVFMSAPDYLVHSGYFLVSTLGWSYYTSFIFKMKDSPLANTMEREEEKKEQQQKTVAEPEPSNTDLLADSPVMNRLNAHLDEVLLNSGLYLDPDLDINMLSQALFTNRTYVGRLFRLRGTTFSHYVNSLRLNHAEELLRTTSKSVGVICEECGFSVATFRRIFSERYNCTPIEYRKSVTRSKLDSLGN